MSDINVTVQDEIVNIDVLDTPVLVNVVNSPGQQGPAGPGVPVGGTAGQVLAKNSSTNYDTVWVNQSGGVPYSGATGNVNIGEYELKAGQVTLDTSPTGTAAVGTIRWNDTTGTSETTLKGGNVIIKNGVDLVARVVNKVTPNTTLTKAAYQAVRVSGAQGQRLAIELAQANNDAGSADTIGLVTETIAPNQEGFIMTVGQLEGINTTGSLQGETWVDGDVLYLSPTTAGAVTNVKPTAVTGHIVVIGYVEYAHQNNGKIYVKVMNGWELDELHNVSIVTPANNQGLFYNSTSTLWENKTISTALGYTPVPTTRNITINGVTYDLSADRTWTISTGISGSGAAGQLTYWGGTSSVSGANNLFWDATNSRLGIGTNVPAVTLDIFGNTNFKSANANNATLSVTTNTLGATLSVTGGSLNTRLLYLSPASGETRLFTSGVNSKLASYDGAGSVIYELNTSGQSYFLNNVHIGGSTNPAVKFQVTGDTLLRGSGSTIATTALTVQNSSSTNLLRVLNDGDVSFGADAFYWDAVTSRLGIGTNVPTSALHVTSTTWNSTQPFISLINLDPQGAESKGLFVQAGALSASSYIANFANYSGTSFFYLDGTGNLGINNTSPSYRLDVNGVARFQNVVRFANNLWMVSDEGSNRLQFATSSSSIYGSPVGHIWRTASDVTIMSLFSNGNLALGQTSDSGQRLQVIGDTLFRGSGATSATTALTVQNSSSTNLFTVRNDGVMAQGGAADAGVNFYMQKSLSGSVYPTGIYMVSTITSTSTNGATMFISDATTQAASFTLPKIEHFKARQTTFGAGSTVTNQYGFFAEGTLTGATNNYGFYGNIASGTGRWNLYMAGTADNYLAGDLGIGTTSVTNWLNIGASTTSKAHINLASGVAPTSPANGDIWFDGTDIKMRIGGVTKTFTLI